MNKLRIGVVGLGRLGKVHAQNIAYKIPNAELAAAWLPESNFLHNTCH